MKFGGGFSIPLDEDHRFMDSWLPPPTPEKPIPLKPHPIPVNQHGNYLQGTNWQQQLTGMGDVYDGIPQSVNPIGAGYTNGGNYDLDGGMTHQTVAPIGPLHTNGGNYGYNGGMTHQTLSPIGLLHTNGGNYGYGGSLADQNQMMNHFPTSSYNAGSFTRLLRDGTSMSQLLHDKAAFVASANMNLSRSVDMAASTPLIPKSHPPWGNQGNNTDSFLLSNENFNNGSYPASKVMNRPLVTDFPSQVDNVSRDSNSLHWLFGNQNHCSSPNPLSNGDSSSQIFQNGFPTALLQGYDLNSPVTEADAASCVSSQQQLVHHALENNELSAVLNSFTDESTIKNDQQVKLVTSLVDEAIQKHGDELLQNIVESSSAAISPLYKESKDSDREGDRGIDLNKTPQQKPARRRKHRPKVIREDKPKSTPKPAIPKNTESKETQPTKRKYVRKNVQNGSPSQLADVTRETRDPNAGKATKACKRVLDFDLEKRMGENQCKAAGQQEEMQQSNKRTFDLTVDSQGKIMGNGTKQVFNTKPAQPISLQNELTVENQMPVTMSNPTPSMNHFPSDHVFLPERQAAAVLVATEKDVHMNNSHVLRRHVENENSDLCQIRCRDGYTPMQQHSHAEGIGQDVIRANTNSENLQKSTENINQGGSRSILQFLSLPIEQRGSKREYRQTVDHTHLLTSHPPSSLSCQETFKFDGHQRNSCTLSKEFLESHKKQKFGNGHLSIYDVPPIEECLGKVERRKENHVNSNGFASKNHAIMSSYIGSNLMMDRQNKGMVKLMYDRYTNSNASGHDFLNRQISSESHSSQDFSQVPSFSTHSMIETCRQLTSFPSRKSFQPGNRQVFQARNNNMPEKKHNRGPTVSKSVSSSIDKALQKEDASYDYQRPSAKAIGFPKGRYTIDDMTYHFSGLNLDGSSEPLENEQNALVPYKGEGAVVPYEGFIKKRKPRPKVDIDSETNRVWNLLMGKEGSGGIEGTDEAKERYWEEERKVFQGRIDSFVARMHLVQGDRRFSRWKGSVVDSVIGVFLTQNVSDHLSSSAFMSLAARFPLKSSNHQAQDKVGENILVEEPEVGITSPCDASKWHEEISSQPIYNQISMTLNKSAEIQRDSERSGTERNAHSQCLEEEFVSSQDSFESSVTQGAVGSRLYSVSNSQAEDPINGCQPNKIHNSISRYQQMEKGTTTFEDFCRQLKESSPPLHDGFKNGHIEYGQQTRSDRIDHLSAISSFTNPIILDDGEMQVPVAPSNNQSHIYPDSGELDTWRVGDVSDESISSWPSTASRINVEKDEKYKCLRNEELLGSVINSSVQQNTFWSSQETPTKDQYGSSIHHSADQQPWSSNGYVQSSYYSHQREENLTSQLENPSVTERVKRTEPLLGKKSRSMQHVQNVCALEKKSSDVADSISVVNKQIHMENQSVGDSSSQDHVNSYGQSHNATSTNTSKGRKGKAESGKKNAIDWDILRKRVQDNDGKKERNTDAMDSLDYEALMNANVKAISDAIKERGMNNMLAERMQEFLKRLVRDHGSIDLEWLRDVPPDKAKDYLLSIRGLGLKSVECVRLLTLHHLAFPVDTNVGRIAVRLGWVPLQPLPESLQLHLLELYPMLESIQKYLWPRLCKLDQLTLYELHYQMITFGKVFCTKSKPNCNACPMRGECRHFASAFASARLALPGPEEKKILSSSIPIATEINPGIAVTPLSLPPPENNSLMKAGADINKSEPIIEEPSTPEQDFTDLSQSDIEDIYYDDPDEIPTIKLNMEQFTETLQSYMQENMGLQEGDMSKALVAVGRETASLPTAKLKNISRLRTEHQVYELPDTHPLLEGMDRREPDDPSPYLLAIWTPGETATSTQPPESRCGSQDQKKLCNEMTCFSCNSIREQNSQTVRGTILIPCRTAMRGSFPLNGTYFQVNEMFADHDSSLNPIDVPRGWIWNLPRRTVYFGTSVSSIFKGLSTEGIQYCFWRGYVCVRGFERKTRAPRPLMARLHFPLSKLTKTRNEEKK